MRSREVYVVRVHRTSFAAHTMRGMTPDLRIQQGIVLADRRGVRVVASSDTFPTPEAERIAVLFGPRPANVSCPLAHFACPCGAKHVAIVQVADRNVPGTAELALGFRFLVLARETYRHLGDPFAIADRFPPSWDATGTLPELAWPMEALPPRTIADVQAVLRDGDTGLLLGGVQSLIDGNRLLIAREVPDEPLLRGLWQLLPTRSRCDLWPASFAFSNELGFHAVAMPSVPTPLGYGDLTEEQVRDYPAGRYELNLHIAAEDGDQAELDRLLARRTSQDTLRLGLAMLGGAVVVALMFKFVL